MPRKTTASPALLLLLSASLAACSGVTDRGKEAPACKGALRPLNPAESAPPRENDFNDLHRGVRPGARP